MNSLHNPDGKITAIKVILEIDHGAKPDLEANSTVLSHEAFEGMFLSFKDKEPASGFVVKKNKVESQVEDVVFKNNIRGEE